MNFGYAVDSVHSAEEALALFDPEIHDLVITDNSILGMTGTERRQLVANRALQIDAWRRAVATPKRIGPDPKVRFSIKWKREEKEQNWIGVAALPVRYRRQCSDATIGPNAGQIHEGTTLGRGRPR